MRCISIKKPEKITESTFRYAEVNGVTAQRININTDPVGGRCHGTHRPPDDPSETRNRSRVWSNKTHTHTYTHTHTHTHKLDI